MSNNLLQRGGEEDDREYEDDRRGYDEPRRRCNFLRHSLRRRRVFLIIAAVLLIAIILVAAIPKGKKHNNNNNNNNNNSGDNSSSSDDNPNGRDLYDNIRLPDWLNPISYDLTMSTSFNDSSYSGKKTDMIVLHAVDLTLSEISIVKQAKDAVALTADDVIASGEPLEYQNIFFDKLMAQDVGIYLLTINFAGKFTSGSLAGYYLSKYGDNKVIATTQFEATDARRAFPCFDEPGKKANFTITMITETGYEAISNMPLQSPSSSKDGLTTFKFAPSPRMSTYLVCFIVHEFKHKESFVITPSGANVTIRVYTTPSTIDQSDYALESTVKALSALNSFFNLSYPLPKLDVVAIPDFSAGAMENWGIVTFRSTYLLFDPKASSASERQRVLDVIVHELAHQWFGNLVTMKWWNDIFLNEGFATFMEYNIISQLEESWNFWSQFQIDVHQSAFDADALLTTHPITNNFTTPLEIASAFDSITYDKGAAVIKMLNSVIDTAYGTDTFRKTIATYLQTYEYSNAEAANLWATFNSTLVNVSSLMNSWVNQPGFPYVTVTKTSTNQVTLSQNRFVTKDSDNSSSSDNVADQSWWIFINSIDSKNNPHNDWNFTQKSVTYSYDWTANGYLLLNSDGAGFYRTFYEEEIFNNLVANLQDFTNIQRTVFVDDAFNFWKAGMLNSSQVLNIAANLKTETDYVVWYTALGELNFLHARVQDVISQTGPCVEEYEKFMQNLLSNAVQTVLQQVNPTPEQVLLKSMILFNSANYGHPQAIETARNIYQNVIKLDANLRNFVLRTVVANGGKAEFDWVLNLYQTSNVAGVKVGCLQALTYTRVPSLVGYALKMALNESIVRPQDTYIVFANFAYNPQAVDKAWTDFKTSINVFTTRYGAGLNSFVGAILTSFASVFSTPEYYSDMANFLQQQNLTTTKAGQQVLELIQINMQWIDNNGNDVCGWLYNNQV